MTRFLLLLGLAACNSVAPSEVQQSPLADSGAAYVPGAQWRTASPAQLGMDSARVAALSGNIATGRYGAIDGVLVIRYGYVALEKYNNWSPNTAHTLQSVTKSVTSLLFGIAATSQPLGLDRPVLDIFPQYGTVANNDDRKRALTLRHLLSMRTSMDFWEQPYPDSPLDQLNRSTGDWVKFVLDRPMNAVPGTTWAYNSGAPIVICGALRQVLGETVQDYARRVLFEPLGITGQFWYSSPYDGLPHCGGGLNLRAQDLARIGYLVLRKGRWGDRQVVPESWIRDATTPITRDVFFTSYGSDYGYYWWLFPSRPGASDDDVITASGSGGQWLFVMPKFDLVVAVIASNGDGLSLLYDGVLPAVK